jgi:outer membrane protein TolC
MTTISRLFAFAAAILPATLAAQQWTPAAPHDTALTLGQAARLAARQSAAVLAAQQRTREASARVRQARAALLPDVSANASRTGRTFNTATFGIEFPSQPGTPPLFDPNGQVEGPVNLWDVRGRVGANLLDLGALGRVRAAQSAQRATGADEASQGELAAAQAAGAYLRALRAEGQFRARLADSTLALDLLGIAQEQLRAGTGVALDVTRAQSQVATTQAGLIAARADRDRAQLDLRRALNLSLDTPVRLADSLGTLPANETLPNEAEAVQRALANRPDLRAAEAQIEAARRQANAIRSERLPTVSAFVDQGNIGKDLQHMLPTYDFAVQVSLPIFDGFRREGRLEEQQAVANELDVRKRDLEAQAAVEVRGALLDVRSAREQVAATAERVRLAEQELSQARERFRAGVAGNADVITASLSLNAARTSAVDALTALQTARVSLARAQGAITDLP